MNTGQNSFVISKGVLCLICSKYFNCLYFILKLKFCVWPIVIAWDVYMKIFNPDMFIYPSIITVCKLLSSIKSVIWTFSRFWIVCIKTISVVLLSFPVQTKTITEASLHCKGLKEEILDASKNVLMC